MLHHLVEAKNRARRNQVLLNRNSLNCVVMRKSLKRTESVEMGIPTIGGLGVLSAEDEHEFDEIVLGNGFALQTDIFQASPINERQDSTNNGFANEFRYLIEPETENEFFIQKGDMMYLIIGLVRVGYEIMNIETTANIPPYVQRYVCSRRGAFAI